MSDNNMIKTSISVDKVSVKIKSVFSNKMKYALSTLNIRK